LNGAKKLVDATISRRASPSEILSNQRRENLDELVPWRSDANHVVNATAAIILMRATVERVRVVKL